MTTLDNQVLKGFHLKVIYTIIGSTCMICFTISGVYFGLKAEIAKQDSKWAVHAVEYNAAISRLLNVELLSSSNEKRITAIESKQSN